MGDAGGAASSTRSSTQTAQPVPQHGGKVGGPETLDDLLDECSCMT
jgi:hypothetical protein